MKRALVAAAFVLSTSAVASVQTPQGGDVPVAIETALGTITIAVDLTHAPLTAANFLKYVDAGLYDGGRFYRVTRSDNYPGTPPNRPPMQLIQGGIESVEIRSTAAAHSARAHERHRPQARRRDGVDGPRHAGLRDHRVFHPAR